VVGSSQDSMPFVFPLKNEPLTDGGALGNRKVYD
jgi:hypothetical protein